jgi:hypothetical protein
LAENCCNHGIRVAFEREKRLNAREELVPNEEFVVYDAEITEHETVVKGVLVVSCKRILTAQSAYLMHSTFVQTRNRRWEDTAGKRKLIGV